MSREPSGVTIVVRLSRFDELATTPTTGVAAGVLHDLVEDTDVTLEELERRLGPAAADRVRRASEPPGGGG